MSKIIRLPDAELEVMQAVWQLDIPARTGEIRSKLEENRPWNLSALQTLLTRLVNRGFLSVKMDGRQRSYTPLIEQVEYLAFENRPYLTGRQGTLPSLVAALYKSRSLTRQDMEELRNFLDEAIGKEEEDKP